MRTSVVLSLAWLGCGAPAGGVATPKAGESCIGNFPNGMFDSSPPGLGGGFGDRGTLDIRVKLESTYELKDHDLAHDVFPGLFIKTMNDARATAGGTDHSFALADGPAHVVVRVNLTHDDTGDYYGAHVTVTGRRDGYQKPADFTHETLFVYDVPATYRTGEKLTAALAEPSATFLYRGWVCDHGVAKKPNPSCTFQPDNKKWLECLGNKP